MTTYDTEKLEQIEAEMPNIVRYVEVDREDGLVLVVCHRSISVKEEAQITAILGGEPHFVP